MAKHLEKPVDKESKLKLSERQSLAHLSSMTPSLANFVSFSCDEICNKELGLTRRHKKKELTSGLFKTSIKLCTCGLLICTRTTLSFNPLHNTLSPLRPASPTIHSKAASLTQPGLASTIARNPTLAYGICRPN